MAKFERVEEIDVTPDKVWKVIITPDVWDEWMPGITGISGAGPAVVGSSYPYQAGDKTGKATVTRLEPGRMLEIVTEVGGHKTTHHFTLSPRTGGLLGLGGVNGTKVDYVMEYAPAGGILGAFVAGGNPVDLLKVKNALARLENLAEKPDLSGGIGKLSS
ncbi:MAG TPA: SRPBCC family protein [Thermoflexales bacterium]|jgi:hypothetical protein|nr:SRPBCC family protein [Thermoflexales bacterium]HQX10775.1 SRPBCC family protein [Thermoflexales bacterium]HQY24385.1 SRPBCC family protein [Thermoflexales bacterium]HQZ54725.1 SRPBCC family protein [Thermoflexales bacterium]HRA53774.1 SRPBCC family protein [Thermoflexales bacterium]